MDTALGLLEGKLSPRLAEKGLLLAIFAPFEQAADLLRRLCGFQVSPDCLEDHSRILGTSLREKQKAQSECISAVETGSETPSGSETDIKYLSMDGSHINTVEGWKENKLAIAFSESDIKRCGTGEKERISIQRKAFATSLAEGLEPFKSLLRHMVDRFGLWAARELVIISDGAIWIRGIVESMFPSAIHILDWFHVTENLWKCGKALFGEGSQLAEEWVEGYKSLLWHGCVDSVLILLEREAREASKHKQTPLRDLNSYLRDRREQMRYEEFRERGYYIGSGSVESANRYVVQDRLKKAGMKWSIVGANAIAHLRAAYMSDQWDPIWARPGQMVA